jgi:hypothetical protein
MLQFGADEAQKYYTLTNDSPAYVAAVIMDPTKKWSYFEEQWSELHSE